MKKKLVILLSAVMIVASTVPAMANEPVKSPIGTPVTEKPKKCNPSSKSAKTGEADFMLYGLGGAASLAVVALVAKKKSEA